MTDFIKYTEKEEFFLLKEYLDEIQNNKSKYNNCKGIIIRGGYGIGKTTFVKNALRELNYEIIEYDHTQSGSKNIENLFGKQSSKESIINIFNNKITKLVILIDNLECINKNERGTLGEILKYIRGKKTKSQKTEEYSLNPVICISNKGTEKKINDINNFTYHPDACCPDGVGTFNVMKLYTDDKIINYMNNNNKTLQVYWDNFEFYVNKSI